MWAKGFCPRSGRWSGRLTAVALILFLALADLADEFGEGDRHVHVERLIVDVIHSIHSFSAVPVPEILARGLANGVATFGVAFPQALPAVALRRMRGLPQRVDDFGGFIFLGGAMGLRLELLPPDRGTVPALAVGWMLSASSARHPLR